MMEPLQNAMVLLKKKTSFMWWYLCYHFSIKPSRKEEQQFTVLITFHNVVEVGLKSLAMSHY